MEERLFEKHRFYLAIAQSLIIIGLIWLAFILNHVFMLNWNDFGVRPRELSGLVGIFTLPFLHADYEHLFSNSLPLFFLLFGLFYFFRNKAFLILLMHYLISGILTWVIASSGVHIGASGMVYAQAFFLVTISILKMEEHGKLGVIVDQVKEVVTLTPNEIDPYIPDTRDEKSAFIKGIGKHSDQLISLLELNSIIEDKEAI